MQGKNEQEGLTRLVAPDIEPECTPLGAILALVALGDFNRLESLLKTGLDKGLEPGDVQEILLQSHLFSGFPRAIFALQLFDTELERRKLKTAEAAHGSDSEETDRLQRGMELFKRVYDKNTDTVLDTLGALYPGYDRWVLEDAYGRVLSRHQLSGKIRELCAVAALTVCGVPKQLRSHIMGALNLGATPEEVRQIIQHMANVADGKKIDDALEILAQLHLT
ncbi:MAG: carboxymuconolactone decarboxylase family protein [Planctomycetota bacterium]|jgi:4-carboxymuconolactone decarboxylase